MVSSTWLRLSVCAIVLTGGCASPAERPAAPEMEEPGIVHIHGLGIDPEDPGTVYVATHFGLHVFADGTWERRSADLADHMGFTLVSGELMFRSGHPDFRTLDDDPERRTNLGVQRSTDGGRTWERLDDILDPPVDFHAMTATRTDPPVLYGWDSGARGTFRSDDAGETWERLEADFPGNVGALAATPDGGAVYASTAEGVWRSADAGTTWTQVGDEVVVFLAAADDVLYASMEDVVLRSEDGGRTWTPTGLEEASLIVALASTPDGRTVLAADRDNRVWRSDDAGETWAQLPEADEE